MVDRRGAATALVVAVLAAAACTTACTTKGGGATAGTQPGPTSPSAGPSPRPMAWRVAESVRLTSVSVLNSVVALDATHAWAGGGERGSQNLSAPPGVPVIERWDGRRWSREKLPDRPRGFVNLVAADSPTNVWAVGGYGESQGDNIYWVLRFDGTAWREVPFPLRVNVPGAGLTGITGLAVVGGRTWLVGYQGMKVVIQEWDGRAWRAHQPPPQCGRGGTSFGGMPSFCTLTSVVAFAPDDVWASGTGAWFRFQGPTLLHWDGTAWRTVDVGVNQQQYVLNAVGGRSSGELWAVGNLFNSGTPFVVRRDGGAWRMVNGLPDGLVPSVAMGPAGQPWVISNTTAPDAMLLTYNSSGGWAGEPAPAPPGAAGMTLNDITAVPGSDQMFAVGNATMGAMTGPVQGVILEYAPVGTPLS
ncbi:MAG TPA: hypothetical protein VFB84_20255 [Micromonosporaceae bacterium]|nr:hypothetical protein [Micromonosporaceae bacterium]